MTIIKTREWTTRNKLGTVRLKAHLKEQRLERGQVSYGFSLERAEPGRPVTNTVIAENIRTVQEAEARFSNWCRSRTWEPVKKRAGPSVKIL